jgi:hypothetical protein
VELINAGRMKDQISEEMKMLVYNMRKEHFLEENLQFKRISGKEV